MRIPVAVVSCLLLSAAHYPAATQDSTVAAPKVPLEHILGTISTIDKQAQTVTVQEDKTGNASIIHLADTKTILKVEPTAKDLKNATRITSEDLAPGDRVDVRGSRLPDSPNALNARSVILMSARALEATHQQQAAAWAHSTNGVVSAVDPSAGTVTINSKSAETAQSIVVKTSQATEFTRFSPDAGKAMPSQISQIETGDQVRVIGEKSADGASLTAQRLYSGAFRTISATIGSLAPDGKSMTVKDLSSKKEVTVAVAADASIHKLPALMAGMLARRLNPTAAAGAGSPATGAPPAGTMPPAGAIPPAGSEPAGPGGTGFGGPGAAGIRRGPGEGGRGDISQMIEHAPTIALSDLKPGDAVVISGVGAGGGSQLTARSIVAGVEPILQAAPQQRGGGRSVGGDWGLGEMSAPQ